MTSRPGPGIQESLQYRGSGGPARAQVWCRPSKPSNNPQNVPLQDCIDPTLEEQRRSAEATLSKTRGVGLARPKPGFLEGIQTATSDQNRPPPRGKPQLFFSTLASNGPEQPLYSPRGPPVGVGTNLPVPPRPGASLPGDGSQLRRIVPGGTGVKGEAAVKAPGTDAPAPAMLFPGGKTADLFPWSGNHPEDTLSESLVKAGISNKPQIMNETNTARPSLWSNLKNKSGLSTLSTLFVAVLEKRQSCGRLTTANTFKPPPRLTLRESTRETWLHDLANPTVSLRRLSRTIPHGINGKGLLEQCLNKNIPIPRAMWLAKCVGINEMRSHKRKGQAGTITWVRGWTSAVEQFLDSTIATIGQQEWKPRITYALQLATHLYKEHLLEVDHFLDWLLKNLESCPAERLFLWLLLVSVYWGGLTCCRRRGKRLGESLLTHAEKQYQLEPDQVSPVLELLENTIVKLLSTSSACLLLPKSWDRHAIILRRLVEKRPYPRVIHVIESLDRRNRRLVRSSSNTAASIHDSTRQVLSLLDSVDYIGGISIETLAYQCIEQVPDPRNLISVALRWASSVHREGSHRLYLVTRVIRKWSQLGADIDDAILSHLHSVASRRNVDPRNVFRIIAELVRSKTFSVGRYLQWLIATGSLSKNSSPAAWPLRLISEIPLSGLSEQILNLRSTLLHGSAYSTELEDQMICNAQSCIQQRIPDLFDTADYFGPSTEVNLTSVSSTVRLELGIWLRQQVAANVELVERVPTKDPSIEEPGPVCTISAQDFHAIRSYLEDFDDLSVLADVLGLAATSLDTNVLTSVADTLHFHYKAFSAIGAFKPLFQKIAMRYAAIRTVRFPERELLVSLMDVARAARADEQLLLMLGYDLSRSEQKNSLAACSPASDNMDTAMDTDDEIDRILSSGTSMDQQVMMRVFGKMAFRLEEQLSAGSVQSENLGPWFYRLRSFDEKAFEKILSDWLSSLLNKHRGKLILVALPPLVVSGCLSLLQFLEISRRCMNGRKASSDEGILRMSVEVLNALLPSEQLSRLCQPQDAYRFRLEQRKLCQGSDGRILQVIHDTLEASSRQLSPALANQITNLLSSNRLRSVLRHFAVSDIQLLSRSLGVGVRSPAGILNSRLKSLLDGLLDPADHLELTQKSLEQQVYAVIDSANDLSLPFCQLEIRQFSAMCDSSAEEISNAFLEAIKAAVEKNESPWSDLVAGLDTDLTCKIREHAERKILNASTFLSSPTMLEPQNFSSDNEALVQKFLTVIDLTASGVSGDGQSSFFASVAERLKGMSEILGMPNDYSDAVMKNVSPVVSQLSPWLHALLRLIVVQDSMLSSKAGSQHQAALLLSLRSLFTHPALRNYASMSEYIFDVAAVLSDEVSDEVRAHLYKLETAKPMEDPRCAFIFGSAPPLDGWLALTKPVTPSLTPQTSSSQQSQPSQAGYGQSPHHQTQQHQSPSPSPIQRSMSQQQQQQQQMQAQAQARMYPQYSQHSQHNKLPPQFQRIGSNIGQNPTQSQLQQMQQMQQMQGLAQQRATQPSPVQLQRQASSTSQSQPQAQSAVGLAGKQGLAKQEKPEMRQLPFVLRRWEVLPESGGNPAGNETAISLSLFGARKV
ncbi:uncharacterized protein BDR25DRAFT_390811 [Lindgomyces ingoldianus]|uniref:Uncharacterized protein n=1 Tax=Lindgomyces ingoldianus TaxID=673940 RepID=A0ACB6RDK3_9PLEO|nr:uncharacterized protein BDR25DRAFT_390811 [Lindgomyces ingoldianus]KAF2477271.1 hypothetical protein BDR25DRAFT_390811 [Lindgomyces ingoldianus]